MPETRIDVVERIIADQRCGIAERFLLLPNFFAGWPLIAHRRQFHTGIGTRRDRG
jgi:hypothetical protein